MAAPSRTAREFDLEPLDNARLANLCGPLDENLRQIEVALDVQIRRRGDKFRVVGAARGARRATCCASCSTIAADEEVDARATCTSRLRERATSAGPPAERPRRAGIRARAARQRSARAAPHQREYLAQIRAHDLTFGIGPAGTGKTYLAVACAVEALRARRGPAHRAGAPGGRSGRAARLPARRPRAEGRSVPAPAVRRALRHDGLRPRRRSFIERNVIEIAPLAFMRGRTLNHSFIILDEAQNTTPEQMKMFLTRIGFGSQGRGHRRRHADRPAARGKKSGLQRRASTSCAACDGIAFTFFDAQDVVRHPLVQRIVRGLRSARARRT